VPSQKSAQAFCRKLIDDPAYQTQLHIRWRNGTIHPTLEVMIWHYAHGKPAGTLNVNDERDLTKLSNQELADRAMQISARIVKHDTTAGPES
jgi:hypothetical protein